VSVVCCLVKDLHQAQRAAARLHAQGLEPSHLSLLVCDDPEVASTIGTSRLTGPGAGGGWRGPAAWPMPATAVTVPGLGPCFAAGPIRERLAPELPGHASPGVPTVLRRLGLAAYQGRACETALRHGQALLGVHAEPAPAARARVVLRQHGSQLVGEVVTEPQMQE